VAEPAFDALDWRTIPLNEMETEIRSRTQRRMCASKRPGIGTGGCRFFVARRPTASR
jgi:hypothetical protein